MKNDDKKVMATNFDSLVDNDQASITTKSLAYTLLSDAHLIKKLAHFDRE
ncbi:MAG: catalase [Prevotellaceae bacterium]|jgi:catalase|nr:catalase [Prevotellaceae bacterium]